ncbi:YheC/YheD family endospore coat-associated protein [Dethiobacter alkaliphilus]|uniref:YheC/YheD family endospore coat-associated protein n=1 Tax=Dethiobacter alkaliphilus TaxID=427926 RepID=UPI0013760D33|nr:YheC/YheD family protein [Dethiobacter alkaliphilus]
MEKKIYLRLANGQIPPGIQLLAKEAVKEGITLVAFATFNMDWWEKRINGLCYSKEDNIWKPDTFPFPHVIYDRATLDSSERQSAKLIRNRFKEIYKIPYINTRNSFGKWITYETLTAYPEISKYLPETHLYNHPCYLTKLLQKNQFAYIKATDDSMGKNIYKVKKAYENVVAVYYREKGRNRSDTLTMEGLYSRLIQGKLKDKNVIIQQGIELASLNNNPFDIRLLVQKNHLGSWEVVDKSVRLAPPGSIVTNVSSGATVEKFEKIVPQVFPQEYPTISQRIDLLALTVCSKLEENFGRLGELAIDMALDVGGSLWLIEVNSKPSKISVRRSQDKELIQRAYSNPVKYAKFLYGVANNETN